MSKLLQNRWVRVIAGAVMMAMLGSMYAWSIYRVPFSERYPQWTISDLSLTFTLCVIFFCIGGILSGRLISRTSNLVGATVGAALILAAFFGVSFLPRDPVTAKWLLYVCYGGLCGLGTGVAYNSVISGVSAWFPDRPGQITGILLTAFGLGSMGIGQLVESLLPTLGLFGVFRVIGVLIAVILVVGSPFIRVPDSAAALPRAAAAKAGGGKEFTTAQMLRRGEFWVFFLWNACMSSASLMVVNSAATIASYYGMIPVLGLLVSVVNGVSRIPFGMCVDALGWKKTLWMANGFIILTAVCLISGGIVHSSVLVLLGLLLMGVAFGNSLTVGALVIRQFFGSEHYAENFPIINACAIIGATVGPTVSGVLQQASGGDYLTTFIVVGVFAAATCTLGCFVKKP